MPLYEYQCKSCKHRFEVIQKFSDKPVKKCPKCGKNTVERLISSPAIQFKGTGWYVTDYAKRSGPTDSKEPKSEKETSKDTGKEAPPATAEKSDKQKDTGKPPATKNK